MIGLGVVQPSNCPCVLPFLTVPKKDSNDWLPTGDYRRINTETTYYRYPLPYINNLTTALKDTVVFPEIGLVKSYNRISWLQTTLLGQVTHVQRSGKLLPTFHTELRVFDAILNRKPSWKCSTHQFGRQCEKSILHS